jgi:predicted XRE-type DNA-binding protein
VWDAIEDDPVERQRLKLLSDLSIRLELRIRAMGWTQKQAAAQLGVTQPRISDLMRGKLSVFSIDSLVELLTRAGVTVELHYKDAA